MKFTYSWLKDFLETDAPPQTVADTLTNIGLELEALIDRAAALQGFVVAEIREARPHPDADKLQVCTVFDGEKERQVVCGAPNARAGIKIVLATEGAVIPNGGFTIKPSKIRGVESNGMCCSAEELGLGEDAEGIIELPQDYEAGTPFARAAGLDDIVFDIAITPNRGDCLGVYGIARDLAAAGLGTLKTLPEGLGEGGFDCPVPVRIEAGTACSAFAGLYIKDADNSGETPALIRRRLEAIGARVISPAVDVTNYMLYSFGRPLHVFDADKLQGGLTVRQARAGEEAEVLDENSYTLSEQDTVIADDNGVQGIAGIIGGMKAATWAETKHIFLEVAMFAPERIARTGRRLNIPTDSRYRFERYVDPGFAMQGLAIAARHIQEICGGTVSRPVIAGSFAVPEQEVSFTHGLTRAITGADISDEDSAAILEKLGFREKTPGVYAVPSWRADISCKQDLAEEVLRIAGYDRIEETPLPDVSAVFPAALAPGERLERRCKRALCGAGLSETVSWSFISDTAYERFGFTQAPELANPISSEWNRMRPSLLPNLLETLAANLSRRLSDYGLFETGTVYTGITPDAQHTAVAGMRIGEARKAAPPEAARAADIFDAKADLLLCLAEAGVNPANCDIRPEGPDYYHPGRKATVRLGKTVLGTFGEIHPAIAEAAGITQTRVPAFECLLAPLAAMQKPYKAKKPPAFSDMQASDRDFCFIVDADVPAGDIAKTLANVDKKLAEECRVFDVYQGEHIPEGKKSVALTVRLRPANAVLTDADLKAFSDKAVAAAEKRYGAVLR